MIAHGKGDNFNLFLSFYMLELNNQVFLLNLVVALSIAVVCDGDDL